MHISGARSGRSRSSVLGMTTSVLPHGHVRRSGGHRLCRRTATKVTPTTATPAAARTRQRQGRDGQRRRCMVRWPVDRRRRRRWQLAPVKVHDRRRPGQLRRYRRRTPFTDEINAINGVTRKPLRDGLFTITRGTSSFTGLSQSTVPMVEAWNRPSSRQAARREGWVELNPADERLERGCSRSGELVDFVPGSVDEVRHPADVRTPRRHRDSRWSDRRLQLPGADRRPG